MSRRRTGPTADSSLELLLDTICNTFGGVLFISLLVVILLNHTGQAFQRKAPSPAAQDELKRLRHDLDESARRATTLEATLKHQTSLRPDIVNANIADLIRTRKQSDAEVRLLTEN